MDKVEFKKGLEGLLDKWRDCRGFDSIVLDKIKLEEAEIGKLVCSMIVTPDICNIYSTLHGGAMATVVDVISSLAVLSMNKDATFKPSVSVEISVNYASAAKMNSKVYIYSSCYKEGKNLAFTETVLKNEKDEVICKGSHTKFILKPKL
ncbi:hypothetical protein CYY_005994 [Polysphondylium violaceum]|uniref:Acyl-coenzyme A thioesterase 13 n=1 Tax=Polysphondylium violaceum TaxID=133409 RepID=A0A8J4UZ93_9MYCE|nr:hypothetical protein CYY_005994 [Polysphondylium violaceum]